jgi:hypothetical protein
MGDDCRFVDSETGGLLVMVTGAIDVASRVVGSLGALGVGVVGRARSSDVASRDRGRVDIQTVEGRSSRARE